MSDDKDLDAPFEPDWACPPGETISDIISRRDIAVDVLASKLHLSASSMEMLLRGDIVIDEDMARVLSVELGASKRFWLTRDAQYRASLVRIAAKTIA